MSLLLRDATDSERAQALKLWVNSWDREMRKDTATPFGESPFVCGLAPFIWQHAHAAAIAVLSARCRIVVAVVADVPDETIGWVCWTDPDARPLTLHYVYVYGPARRQGIGATLLRHALAHADERVPRMTHANTPGLAALARAAGQERAA